MQNAPAERVKPSGLRQNAPAERVKPGGLMQNTPVERVKPGGLVQNAPVERVKQPGGLMKSAPRLRGGGRCVRDKGPCDAPPHPCNRGLPLLMFPRDRPRRWMHYARGFRRADLMRRQTAKRAARAGAGAHYPQSVPRVRRARRARTPYPAPPSRRGYRCTIGRCRRGSRCRS